MNRLNLIWLTPIVLWLAAVAAGTLYTFGWLLRRNYGLLLLYAAIVGAAILLFRP